MSGNQKWFIYDVQSVFGVAPSGVSRQRIGAKVLIDGFRGTVDGKNEGKHQSTSGDSRQRIGAKVLIDGFRGAFDGKNEEKHQSTSGDSRQQH